MKQIINFEALFGERFFQIPNKPLQELSVKADIIISNGAEKNPAFIYGQRPINNGKGAGVIETFGGTVEKDARNILNSKIFGVSELYLKYIQHYHKVVREGQPQFRKDMYSSLAYLNKSLSGDFANNLFSELVREIIEELGLKSEDYSIWSNWFKDSILLPNICFEKTMRSGKTRFYILLALYLPNCSKEELLQYSHFLESQNPEHQGLVICSNLDEFKSYQKDWYIPEQPNLASDSTIQYGLVERFYDLICCYNTGSRPEGRLYFDLNPDGLIQLAKLRSKAWLGRGSIYRFLEFLNPTLFENQLTHLPGNYLVDLIPEKYREFEAVSEVRKENWFRMR